MLSLELMASFSEILSSVSPSVVFAPSPYLAANFYTSWSSPKLQLELLTEKKAQTRRLGRKGRLERLSPLETELSACFFNATLILELLLL